MPLKLKPPKEGRSIYWYVRGTFLGHRLDRSTQTTAKAEAAKIKRRWEREIIEGRYGDKPAEAVKVNTLAAATLAYMNAGGDSKFLRPIMESPLATMAIDAIDQIALDNAAAALYPRATAATRNRQFYTPVIAVLRRAGIRKDWERPKGWQSPKSVSWLEPEQAFALFAAADNQSAEFGLFVRLLCYTGMRLSEALGITIGMVNLADQAIYLPMTKNGEARKVHLTPELVTALANHPRKLDRAKTDRLIKYHASGALRDMLKDAMKEAGLSFPRRQGGFHLFCHTWATWMRRFGGLDTSGLLETKRWRSRQSAARYEHLDATEESRKADLLPTKKGMA